MRIKSLLGMFSMTLLAMSLVACGDDDDGGGTIDGSISLIDAGNLIDSGASIDATAACALPANTTLAISAANAAVFQVTTPPAVYQLQHQTGPTQGTDEFVFIRVPSPVTVPLTVDLTMTCTAATEPCITFYGNFMINAQNQVDGDVYFGLHGSMTITEAAAAGAGNFVGTVTGLQVDHYTDQGGGGLSPAPDQCKSTVADFSFSLPVMAGKPSAPGTPGEMIEIAVPVYRQ
jgi:hypothetical protein